ncbi:hypothetical protein B0H13DRAFT_2265177 [Mycena leptocephala]|nr:hypothetical protein B0H13DRAFT_2265177 [Mycena leptocephala]
MTGPQMKSCFSRREGQHRGIRSSPQSRGSRKKWWRNGGEMAMANEASGYIKNHGGTEYHAVGSAAMLPQEKGGVVSPELKVYGTSNIRVVDVVLDPTDTNNAEKAAEIIRGIITV